MDGIFAAAAAPDQVGRAGYGQRPHGEKRMGLKQPRTAVFLDRDGTLIEEAGYLSRPEQVQIYPEAFEAVRRINRSRRLAVVITNQSGVARGLVSEEQLVKLHEIIGEAFRREQAPLHAFYYCPHHPEAGDGPYTRVCDCRKPQPGLLLQATRDLGLDVASSYMVGDSLRDVEAGHRAGCRSVLVRTGYGQKALGQLETGAPREKRSALSVPDFVARNIIEGVNWILD